MNVLAKRILPLGNKLIKPIFNYHGFIQSQSLFSTMKSISKIDVAIPTTLAFSRLSNIKRRLTGQTTAEVSESEPKSNKMEGSYHWYFERALSIALIPMFCMSATVGGNPVNDLLLGVVLPAHIHMGLGSIIMDYLPFRKFPILHIVMLFFQYLATFGSIYGCYMINTTDIGITEYFIKLWKA